MTSICIFPALFIVFVPVFLYVGNVKAGKRMHRDMLMNIMASPMMFFDSTPIGRIINRFGKDIDVLDTLIPRNFEWVLDTSLTVTAVVVVIGYSTPMFLVMLFPLAVMFLAAQV